MILVDTGVLLSLQNRRDRDHKRVQECYEAHAREAFFLHALILTEAWYLCESRIGVDAARALAASVSKGELGLLPVEGTDVGAALAIERRYSELQLGLTDAMSLALCVKHGIDTVFTLDRRDFVPFRFGRGQSLTILP